MDEMHYTNRRTVLKTLGASAFGGMVLTGPATAHGGDEREQAWLLTDVWEMGDREPSGEDPTDDSSHVPIYYIAPGAMNDDGHGGCPQVRKDFSKWEDATTFAKGEWDDVPVDQTLHDLAGTDEPPITEFTTLWHEQFVFDKTAVKPYSPGDLVNTDHNDAPLIDSGSRIQAATNVDVVSVPNVFNCPARPAQGEHLNYCQG